jgi:hypothetical protein
MLRPLGVAESLEIVEEEIVFTLSALQSDPRAVSLLPMTQGWLELVRDAQKLDRRTRSRVVNAEARRVVSNENLDDVCEAFGADLRAAVGGDTTSQRWQTFFGGTVGRFVRQALRKQVVAVAGWLARDDEPTLEPHRRALDHWTRAATAAVEDTAALATMRAQNQIRREHLAEDLTREREALHDALTALAAEHNLPASWTTIFFRRSLR